MGCNCGGSTARTNNKEPRRFQPTIHERPASTTFRPRREGGPGDPRYYAGGNRTPQKPA